MFSKAIQRGFTLLEAVLVVAVIAVLAGLSIPLYRTFQVSSGLSTASHEVGMYLRRAQILSRGMDGDTPWGVYVQDGSVTLFQGADYLSRNTGLDEQTELPGITVSGLDEVVFEKWTGDPSTTGTFTLEGAAGLSQSVKINQEGVVSYE